MYCTITSNSSGETLDQFVLDDDDLLDCDIYAERFTDQYGYALAESTGHIPGGCGDFTVELADNPGTAVCWTSKDYYFETE